MATTLTVKSLKGYINAGLAVVISGVHGVGKTAKLKEACSQLGLTVKYYSASTLDPYTDLVGIPVPNTETKTVEYFRPHEIDKADVIFFDEINRADPKTLNTIMEIILDHSINGEVLPNLKCVVSAMNPVSDDYATDELDAALLDRFDVFLQADPEVDLGYFVKKFGDAVGKAAVEFWNEYHGSFTNAKKSSARGNEIPYLSPRRLDKIVAAFVAIPARQTIVDCLPPAVIDASVASNLYRSLSQAQQSEKPGLTTMEAEVQAIVNSPISNQRSAEVGRKVAKMLQVGIEDADKARLLTSLAISLNSSKGAPTLVEQFGEVIQAMTPTQMKTMTDGWPAGKVADLERRLAA